MTIAPSFVPSSGMQNEPVNISVQREESSMNSFWGNVGVFAVLSVIVFGYAKIVELRGSAYQHKADEHDMKSPRHLRSHSAKKIRP
jgi:hypothetical protein